MIAHKDLSICEVYNLLISVSWFATFSDWMTTLGLDVLVITETVQTLAFFLLSSDFLAALTIRQRKKLKLHIITSFMSINFLD